MNQNTYEVILTANLDTGTIVWQCEVEAFDESEAEFNAKATFVESVSPFADFEFNDSDVTLVGDESPL